jgi:GTP cyclohydrolase I
MELEQLILHMLTELGEDPQRVGLRKTPSRVAESLKFLTSGYRQDPDQVLAGSVLTAEHKSMVVVKDIDFFSMCEHHLLPFFGKCHVAYIPDEKIVGLSKLAHIVEIYSRRLQVQERMTWQIAETIQKVVKPVGVGVIAEAEHLCMQMRGVEKQNSVAVTSTMLGEFHDSEATRAEFLAIVRQSRPTAH